MHLFLLISNRLLLNTEHNLISITMFFIYMLSIIWKPLPMSYKISFFKKSTNVLENFVLNMLGSSGQWSKWSWNDYYLVYLLLNLSFHLLLT